MKKIFSKLLSGLFVACLAIAACQKESLDTTESTTVSISSNDARANSCRTTVFDWPNFAKFEFRYNEKGLADQWIIDYGFGLPLHTNELIYDVNGRLIQSNETYFGLNNVWHFYYTGQLLTRLTRDNPDFPPMALDVALTYNNLGQVIREDDHLNNTHFLMTYDNMGNCTRTDMYIGNELVYTDIYTFSTPVRNPRAAVPGIDIGFLFGGPAGFTDKWHFTSNRTEIYDNGSVFLTYDYDPAQTVINRGNHNYPISAFYFDRAMQSAVNLSFDYENCNGNGGTASAKISQTERPAGSKTTKGNSKPFLLRGSAESIRDQIKKLKEIKASH